MGRKPAHHNTESTIEKPLPTIVGSVFSIKRKDGGYCVIKYNLNDDNTINEVVVTEPDVLVIALSKLETFILKSLDL